MADGNNVIRVSKSSIVKEISNLNGIYTTIDDCISNTEGDLQKISECWGGVDAAKYIDSLSNVYVSELKKLNGLIKSYSDYLQSAKNKYSELDDNASNSFKSVGI